MRSFEELVLEAEQADVDGWGFGFLEGRATEERPSWRYVRLLAERLGAANCALDLDTGGGEVLAEALGMAASSPPRMVVTEAWPPNAAQAQRRLAPWGVDVVRTALGSSALPLPDASFDLVTARHPVAPDFAEIHRVVAPGGTYLAQHVGAASAFELIEAILGPLSPEHYRGRDAHREAQAARDVGLEVKDLRVERPRMEFFDIGAIVWILRKCVWWVPDFSAARYEPQLRALDARMRGGEPFIAHSTRHLIQAQRPGGVARS